MKRLTLALAVLSIVGCAKSAPDCAAPPGATAAPVGASTAAALTPLDKKQFGAPISEKTTTALVAIAHEPTRFNDKTVRTEGLVTAVCQSMGCWMQIGDETSSAHIKMAGHTFFVPRNASGHHAVVQGKVLSKGAGNACEGDHDGCREKAEQETGKVAQIEIDASGVEFVD